jgi:hypothetical protein
MSMLEPALRRLAALDPEARHEPEAAERDALLARILAEPREEPERRAVKRRSRRSGTTRRRAAVAATAIVVAAVAVILAMPRDGGAPSRFGGLAEARAALTTHGDIIYTEGLHEQADPAGKVYLRETRREWATDRRWRTIDSGSLNGLRFPATERVASANLTRTYDPSTKSIHVSRGPGPPGGSTLGVLRAWLRSTNARDAGDTELAGRPVRRYVAVSPKQRVTFYLDRTTAVPVRIVAKIFRKGKLQSISTTIVRRYRRLPYDADLLRLHTPPGTPERVQP